MNCHCNTMASIEMDSPGGALLSSCSSGSFSVINDPEGTPDFVSDIDIKVQCSMCNSVLRNAIQLPCGHHVCLHDLPVIFSDTESGVCALEDCKNVCRKEEVFPDASKRREISKLLVHCTFKSIGCKENLMWRDLHKHVQWCRHKGLECEKCHVMVLLSEITSHRNLKCECRLVPCDYCLEPIIARHLPIHVKTECRLVPVECPNRCTVTQIPMEQVKIHMSTCPNRKDMCTFSPHGCTFKGTKDDLSLHRKAELVSHVEMLTNRRNTVQRATDASIGEIKEIIIYLVREAENLPCLKEENEELRKECQVTKKSVQNMMKLMASFGERNIQTTRALQDKASSECVNKLKHEVTVMADVIQGTNQRIRNMECEATGGRYQIAIEENQRQITLLERNLNDTDLKIQLLETVNYNGELMWVIKDYTLRKQEATYGRILSLYSQPFYTSRYGYKLCARVYLCGDGSGKGTHLSLFLVVMKGDFDALLPWPFQLPVKLMLLDQTGTHRHISDSFKPNPNSNSFQRPNTDMNVACGVPRFVPHTTLETDTYLRDDIICLRAVVDSRSLPILF